MTGRLQTAALNGTMRAYSAFGLAIHSVFVLPLNEEPGPTGEADVIIGRGLPCDGRTCSRAPDHAAHECAARQDLDLGDWGKFAVIAGSRIHAVPGPASDERTMGFFLLERLLALALYQRGLWLFHASVVAMEEGAVAILAPPGGGKTSVALALQAAGHAILDDDILALDPRPDGSFLVRPGLPMVKVWPDQAGRFGFSPLSLARQLPGREKLVAPLQVKAPAQPLPLRMIYVLGYGPELTIEPLLPNALMPILLTHWYGFLHPGEMFVDDKAAMQIAFHQAAGVARHTPGASLLVPRQWEGLAEVDEIIRKDLARLPRNPAES